MRVIRRGRVARPSRSTARAPAAGHSWDRERERRAEARARELLRGAVGAGDFAMYEELGFLLVSGGNECASGYAYLVYPYRPLVAFDRRSGELLSELCVTFRDEGDSAGGGRLPPADDVLAKWLALRGSERELIGLANLSAPGWQVDPAQARRDLGRAREWLALRAQAPPPRHRSTRRPLRGASPPPP